MIILTGMVADTPAPWLWIAAASLVFGVAVATARKTLAGFSRKALQEKLAWGDRDRFVTFFDRRDEYEVCLRVLDQGTRILVVVCLAFLFPRPVVTPDPAAQLGWFLLVILGVVALLVVCLELIPGILSRMSPEGLMLRALPVINLVYRCMAAPMRGYEKLVNAAAAAIGSQPPRKPLDVVEEEILTAVEEGGREGLLQATEMSMIEAIFRFRDRSAAEVLTPRTQMVAIDVHTSIHEAVRIARDCGHSRVPVYSGNKDRIVGILYAKDLLEYWESRAENDISLRDVVRKAHFVPKNKKVSELFQEFKSQRFHIAIVQDEFGGTSGLITIEDVIEEILGEIEDEFELDEERSRIVRVSAGEIEVDARVPVSEFNAAHGAELEATIPEGNGFDTVGGFLFSAMGRIPATGESYTHGTLRFEVVDADDRMVRRIRVTVSREGAHSATES